MVTTRAAYAVLVGLVGLERLVELGLSARHVRRARARGAVEAGQSLYRWMVAVHASFLPACLVEVWALSRPWRPGLAAPMLAVVASAMALRYWVVATLGQRWTTRVVYVPGDPLITGGPFRWLRHPNYVAVAAEVAALPLVHSAWITSLVYSAVDAIVLKRRIAIEDQLLADLAATESQRG